jgi:hypothetical protein
MPTAFDGDNLIVTLPAPTGGVLNLSWREDVYEAWKDWLLGRGSNFKYPRLFDTFGGDQLIEGSLNAGAYFVVRNDRGWRFRPDESDHTVYATDNLPAKDSNLPIMIPTVGAFTVLIDGIRPNTEVVAIGSGVTAQDKIDIIDELMTRIMENGETFAEAMRLMRAEAAGTIILPSAGKQDIYSADGLKKRIEATADETGRTVDAVDGT